MEKQNECKCIEAMDEENRKPSDNMVQIVSITPCLAPHSYIYV